MALQLHGQDRDGHLLPEPLQSDGHLEPELLPPGQQPLRHHLRSRREKIVTVPRKKNQRDFRKMKKAELAAEIDKCVQSELLERLTKGCYGEIYNSSFNDFNTILNHKSDVREIEDEKEYELEYVQADDIEMEMDGMEDFEGLPNSEDGDIDEDDDLLHEAVAKKQKGSGSNSRSMVGKRSMKVITELEHDEDTHHKQRTLV
ncbi:uncharacterized protein LOC133919054 [Phragmites australis]|uniref:uncharacterized protein LOC133919054 n=1 Tax=Phragmites australis TaxID=29695 RepID=UPI002D79E864|nr:uncharacterized protein LOC133919054 [Phragmites australis]